MFEKEAAKIAGNAVALSVLFALGVAVGAFGYRVLSAAKVARLESAISTAEARAALSDDLSKRMDNYCTAIDSAAAKQSAAILEISQRAEANASAAADAVDAARKASSALGKTAAELVASRAPEGVDECAAARASFDSELRTERTGDKE